MKQPEKKPSARTLATRAKIISTAEQLFAKKGGKIEITFFTEEDLDRIFGKISG